MFEKLKEKIAEMSRRPAADPSQFNDPLAERTQWTPLKPGGTNFRTHKLVLSRPERMEFKPTWGMKIFCAIFCLVGLGTFVGMLAIAAGAIHGENTQMAYIFLPIFGGIFFIVGSLMYCFAAKPRVFDSSLKYFWKGRKSPETSLPGDTSDNWVPLEDIHAIQVISEYVSGDKSSYYSYELNLVRKDAGRFNVIDHGNAGKIRADAQALADFLGVPLWDTTL